MSDPDKNGILITRIFDASRSAVWKAWTEPERLMRWWGPKTFTSPVCKTDLRVGEKYLFCMRSLDGEDFWSTGIYKEIIPLERLTFTDSFADEKGNIVPASYYGMPGDDWPIELLVTISFEDIEGKTKLTLNHVGLPEGQMKEMCILGWNESFDKLEENLR